MKVERGIWDKLSRVVLLLLFVAGLLGVAVWYLPLVQENERFRQKVFQKRQEIRREEERARQMEAAIRALRTDPRAVERLAREKLGYIRPGETRIQFEQATPDSARPLLAPPR